MVYSVLLFAIAGERVPTIEDAAWSIAAGVAGAIGLSALYAGLASGRMSVVAPVTGVLAAIIPVLVGIVLEGVPQQQVLVGIALALGAVVLVSRVADETGRSGGLRFALVAGTAIGLFNVLIAQVSDGVIFGPLAIMRGTQVVALLAVIVVGARAWRMRGTLVPAVLVIALLDLGGNAFYVAARQAGELAIAATLSSLYPVATAILAAVILRERVTVSHAFGIVLAGIAVALIASGAG